MNIRSVSDLLYLFRDNQAPKSVTSAQFQDLIASLHLATGNFTDLPTSAAGLARGRLYLNGDTLQVSVGGVPSAQTARFSGAATASFSATARARVAARAVMGGAGGITATSSSAVLFEDIFNTLSLNNQFANQFGQGSFSSAFSNAFAKAAGPSTGTWYPSQYWAPDNAGYALSTNTWTLNPFNPATPISGSYSVASGNMRLLMQDTPAQYLAACANRKYIGTQIVAPNVATFGRFEARLSIPSLNGTMCSFFLISTTPGGVQVEVNMEIPTGSTWSPRSQWQFAALAPGYTGTLGVSYSWSAGMPVIDVTQMNTYAFEMRPTYVSCQLNGIEVLRVASPPEFGQSPWYIYFEQIDGGAWTGPMDATPAYAPMLVDYVRVTA